MKFHEFSFQKKLFISCILLNSLLLVGFSLFFYYYSANSLRENMRSTLSGSASMIQNNLDTLLNDADNTLKELQLNASLLDTARNIPEGENNYLPTHTHSQICFSGPVPHYLDVFRPGIYPLIMSANITTIWELLPQTVPVIQKKPFWRTIPILQTL